MILNWTVVVSGATAHEVINSAMVAWSDFIGDLDVDQSEAVRIDVSSHLMSGKTTITYKGEATAGFEVSPK